MTEVRDENGFDRERVAFFSDAVMAIAITLLVIELPSFDLPDMTDADLRVSLELAGPSFFAVALSFVVIALWWHGHHRLYRELASVDGPMIVLNFLFLAAIAFLPFPTNILGLHSDLPTAVILYAATNFVAGGALWLMRVRAERQRLYRPGSDPEQRRLRLVIGALPPVVFGLSIPVALVAPFGAVVSWNAIWIAGLAVRIWWVRTQQVDA